MTTADARAERRRRVTLIVVLIVLLGIPLVVGGSYIAGIVLVVAAPLVFIVVPLGALYGLVARVTLWMKRRSAHRAFVDPAEVPGGLAAAGFRTGLQRADRFLSVVLLVVIAAVLAYFGVAALLQTADHIQFAVDDSSVAGLALAGLAAFPAEVALVLVVAIPVAAVVVTMQIVRRDVLVGEAFALSTRSEAFTRIRTSRALSRIATALLFSVLVIAVVFGPRYLGF